MRPSARMPVARRTAPLRPGRGLRLGLLAVSLCAAGTLTAQDFDGDAIPDAIEEQGWYVAAGGSPQRQDVWVECDYMPGTVRKRPTVRRRAEGVFARAPVPGGIALHLSFDDAIPFEAQWGDVGTAGGFMATFDRALEERDRSFDVAPFTGADAETMRPYVHYCVYVESIGGGGVSGYSFGIPGDLFVVAVGQYRGEVRPGLLRAGETGILLHELGHNLGLTHGGAAPLAHSPYKPNHLSVMSYLYAWAFVRLDGERAEYFPYWDYSRAESGLLHEKRLREEKGVVVPEAVTVADTPRGDRLLGLFYCADDTFRAFFFNFRLDFDCDGVVEPGRVKADINRDGARSSLGRGQDDWSHLIFGTAGLGASRSPVLLDPLTELRRPDVERLVRTDRALRTTRVTRPERP